MGDAEFSCLDTRIPPNTGTDVFIPCHSLHTLGTAAAARRPEGLIAPQKGTGKDRAGSRRVWTAAPEVMECPVEESQTKKGKEAFAYRCTRGFMRFFRINYPSVRAGCGHLGCHLHVLPGLGGHSWAQTAVPELGMLQFPELSGQH